MLEQIMFQLVPRGQQRISQHDVVRHAVPEFDSGDREGSTADCRQFDWWHNNTAGERIARRPGRSATRTSGSKCTGASPCRTLYCMLSGTRNHVRAGECVSEMWSRDFRR